MKSVGNGVFAKIVEQLERTRSLFVFVLQGECAVTAGNINPLAGPGIECVGTGVGGFVGSQAKIGGGVKMVV